MRLWSIHPKYLDRIGLLALWREGLLARKVLEGKTREYKRHPQLIRFTNSKNPIGFINAFLFEVYKEAKRRGYNFDKNKIMNFDLLDVKIPVTSGQIKFEFKHLLKKLKVRDKKRYKELSLLKDIKVNRIFKMVCGGIESWEKP